MTVNHPVDFSKTLFEKLAQNALGALDVLAQNMGAHDDEPMLERLRRGEHPMPHSFVAEDNSFREDGALRLINFDESIAKIEDAVQRLKKSRDRFQRSLNMATSLLAPVWRLPEDILAEIFSLYIQEQGEYSFNLKLSSPSSSWKPTPCIRSSTLHLSQICSFWRRIIFGRPLLWSSLWFNLDALNDSFGPELPGILSVLSDYLSRSGSVPLKLGMSQAYVSGNNPNRDYVFELLLRHAMRWESLSLTLRSNRSVSYFLSQFQSGGQLHVMSRMKHLVLDSGLECVAILIQSSNLRTLDASHLNLSWSNFRQCDFSSLKELKVFRLGGAPVGRFLYYMPALERLEIKSLTSGSSSTELESRSPLGPSNLRHLTIGLEDNCPAATWKSLCVPHLTSLRIYSGKYSKGSVEAISTSLCQSNTVLRELEATFDDEVMSLICSHPSLNELTLRYNENSEEGALSLEDMLSRLTISKDPETTVLGPNLYHLAVNILKPIPSSFKPLPLARNISEMVKSRASVRDLPPGVSTLQSFSLQMPYGCMARIRVGEISTLLAPLVASGLQLQLSQLS
ncbi:hypothetical protein D9757_012812 [Collybiopsis confluens]|uniref:F-box domain-containing protein n=1 Tax=Collybiopsis confluens TaxID=2823264 RepID=A0A8H5FZM9_9AGAR|nr:hypothetical protein D9757_012812 [Collybiopsis confluens]